MSKIDRQYLDLIEDISSNGDDIPSRNSLTRRITTKQITFNSTPLISVRRTAWKQAIREMEWFLSGSININTLHDSVKHWWSPWADAKGKIFNHYGRQFRNFSGKSNKVDQLTHIIDSLKIDPYTRRHVISLWNTADMVYCGTVLANCHGTVIQCFVNPDNTVDMTMYQRSADIMLGVPHNFIQYWAFLMYICHQSGRKVGKFTWIGGDIHIYEAHFEAADECIHTNISGIETPQLTYIPTSDIFKAEDFSLDGEYKPIIKKSLEVIV